MIREKTEILMWEKIDGTISPEDETRLEEVLIKDAEAREHYEELIKFTELLGEDKALEPPTVLRQRIENAINFDRYTAPSQSPTPTFLHRWFPFKLDFRLAAASAAGLIVGVIAYHLVVFDPGSKGSLDNASLRGTIGSVSNAFKIDLAGVQGTVNFRHDETLAVSSVEIVSSHEIELYLEYEGRSVEFRAVGNADSPLHDISVAGNTIIVKNLGEGEYLAIFRREGGADAPLRIRVVSGGELLLEKEIQPGRL